MLLVYAFLRMANLWCRGIRKEKCGFGIGKLRKITGLFKLIMGFALGLHGIPLMRVGWPLADGMERLDIGTNFNLGVAYLDFELKQI